MEDKQIDSLPIAQFRTEFQWGYEVTSQIAQNPTQNKPGIMEE